jgi:flagellar basal-body rod protein FlgC
MKRTLWLRMISTLLIINSPSLYAKSSECSLVKRYQLALSAHGSNLANEKTTRTRSGGAYQLRKVSCFKKCRIIKLKDHINLYEPHHPDANQNGYVTYPNMDPATEITKFMAAINRLEIIAKRKKCGLSYAKASKGFFIKYAKGKIKEDHFILPGDILITGWQRTLKNGEDSLVSFSNY